jgi:3-dehydroquinate dehydratase-1
MPAFCLPLIEPTLEQLRRRLAQAPADYEFCEVWLDYLPELTSEQLKGISAESTKKLVFVSRRLELAPPLKSFEYRLHCLRTLAHLPVYLDLDIETQANEISQLSCEKAVCTRLWSYHNYQHTPALPQLNAILSKMQQAGADICKFSCFCADSAQALSLFELLQVLKQTAQRFIVSGMGQEGLLPRLAGALWGNQFSFAPLELAQASAPGQLRLGDFQHILSLLGAHGGK